MSESHVSRTSATYEWVTFEWHISHILTHMCHTYVKHLNQWCRTYKWVTHDCKWLHAHIWVAHLTHMSESQRACSHLQSWVTHLYVRHHWFKCLTWLVHMCEMTHSNVWRDSFICVPWLFKCVTRRGLPWGYAFICVTWLIHMWEWLIHMREMTHSCVENDSFLWVTWLIHMCDMIHSCVENDAFICVGRICINHVALPNESCHTCEQVTHVNTPCHA